MAALEAEDIEYLSKFKNAHHAAREVLSGADIQTAIEETKRTRAEQVKNTMFFNVLRPMAAYMQVYGTTDAVGQLFGKSINTMTQPDSLKALAEGSASTAVGRVG